MALEEGVSEPKLTAGQRLDAAIDATRDKVGRIGSEIKERVAKGREVVAELRKKNVDDLIGSAKDFAREHPATTLLTGVALGFLIGYFTRRRD